MLALVKNAIYNWSADKSFEKHHRVISGPQTAHTDSMSQSG